MKLFFIASRFHGGGAQRVFLNIINHLSKMPEYDISLVLYKSKEDDVYLQLLDKGCKTIVLQSSAKVGWIKLSSLIRKECPDVILSTLNYINVSTTLAVLMSRVKSKLIVREASDIMKSGAFLRKVQRILYRKRVDLAWAITEDIAKDIEGSLGVLKEKIFLAPNPLSMEAVHVSIKDCDVEEPIKLLYCGRLTSLKRIDLILKGLAITRRRDWIFTIVGKGEEEGALKKLTKELGVDEQVRFVGYSSSPYSYMLESDIFLLASKWEGFPNVVTEAMYCGNMCIAHDTEGGGIRYINSLIPAIDIVDFLSQQKVADRVDYYLENHVELRQKKNLAMEYARCLQVENFYTHYFKKILI